MWSTINDFLTKVDDLVWGVPLIILILCGGLLLTIRLGLLQVRKLPLALKWMVKNEEDGKGEISSFSALCTALSATIGTGNIVGVATAVCAGRSRRFILDDCCRFLRHGNQIFRRSAGCKIPCCGRGWTQPRRSLLLHRAGHGIEVEMDGKIICLLWCLRWSVRYRNLQPGKWYCQCGQPVSLTRKMLTA